MSAKQKTPSKKKAEAKTASARTKAATGALRAKKGKVAKAVADAKPKRLSVLDAAAQILKAAGKPMRAQELIDVMAKRGLWTSPKGKTPHATLSAALQREIKAKPADARFVKIDRGLFTHNERAAK